MGAKQSKRGQDPKKVLEQRPRERDPTSPPKLLFCGCGSTGKSTFLRAAREVTGHGCSPEELKQFAPILRWNALYCMKLLLRIHKQIPVDLHPARKVVESCADDNEDKATGEAIARLWADPGLQYAARSLEGLADSLGVEEQLFCLCPGMFEPTWVPTSRDLSLVRVRTTGIVESTITYGEHALTTLDVGGQREERKKWIHCFEGLSGLAFFVGLPAAMEQALYEDSSTPRLREDFTVWQDIAGSRWFPEPMPMFLVLNKADQWRLSTPFVSVAFLETCTSSLPPPLLGVIAEYLFYDSKQLELLEDCLSAKMNEGETPMQFVHRRFLSFRPSTKIIECNSTDPASVRAGLEILFRAYYEK